MNKLSSQKSFVILSVILSCLFVRTDAQSCEDILNKMFKATAGVRTLRTNMSAQERIENHFILTRYSVKINKSPYKVYSKDLDKGIEVIYQEGKNSNEATVNPNGFPYINLHLDALGKIMRKDQHQTLGRMGFDYFSNMLSNTLAKYPNAYTQYVKQDADTIWDGNACYKIELNFSSYSNVKYAVKESGETVAKLAAKYYLSEYQILTLNDISWYDDVLTLGKQILLPTAYAKSTILFIRKDNFLPVVLRIYDDKGFFESYTYTNLQLNPPIPDSEFLENYPDYHF